jgi:hypothetical protein
MNSNLASHGEADFNARAILTRFRNTAQAAWKFTRQHYIATLHGNITSDGKKKKGGDQRDEPQVSSEPRATPCYQTQAIKNVAPRIMEQAHTLSCHTQIPNFNKLPARHARIAVEKNREIDTRLIRLPQHGAECEKCDTGI